MYGSARAEVRLEPKGVIGNIVPWNFPFDLGMGPLIDALAAGNRMIIKPSEFTPACAAIMRDMMRAAFDRDLVDVAVGDLELAKTFPTLRWDHLLYTGSTRIGREVAKAAAENLVPVTLELGGKCPAIVGSDAVDTTTVGNIVGVKMIKNGQMCTSVDYCLVPREQVSDFVQLARDYVASTTPDYSATGDCPGIISERHVDRLVGLLDEAREAGCEVVQLDEGGELNRSTRQMPLSLVVDPPEELGLMQEEIFGPILAVRSYDTLDEAIDYVNSRERPLGLYVMSRRGGGRRAGAVQDELGRRRGERVRDAGRDAVALLRGRGAQRHRPPPRRGRLPRVLEPARRVLPRRRRPDRHVRAALRGAPTGDGGRRAGRRLSAYWSGMSSPCSSVGRGPKMRRSPSSIGTSLMLASRRLISPCSSNSHSSFP